MKKKTKKSKNKDRKYILLFIILIILLIYLGLNQNKTILTSAATIDDILSVINKNSLAKVSRYIVYGTHLNLEGSLEIAEDEIADVTVVARKDNEEEIEINTTYKYEDGKLSFSTLKNINEGLDLETLDISNYYILLKITNDKKDIKYYSMANNTEYVKPIEYYTLTRNNSNNKIDIRFITKDDLSAFALNVSKVHKLPEDTYDVVIDPGHGGNDSGAISGKEEEADIVLECGLKLKKELENLGLKVLITRDGKETEEYDTYNIYDEDGRVTLANKSKAKILVSLHMNSNESDFVDGGVEVYAAPHLDLSLAKLFADNIVENANTNYSEMQTFKEEERCICKNNRSRKSQFKYF